MAKILLVEDHPTFARLFKFYLQQDGHTIIHAADGLLGLKLFQQELPDLMITDIAIPVMSGIQLIEKLREEYINTNIIALYFEDQERNDVETTSDDLTVASKEITRPEFLALVNRQLNRAKGKPSPKQPSDHNDPEGGKHKILPIAVSVSNSGNINITQPQEDCSQPHAIVTVTTQQLDQLLDELTKARKRG